MTRMIAALISLSCMAVSSRQAVAAAIEQPGVWLMGTKLAIQFFDCSNMVCGRVIWLKESLDPQGLLKRDKLNPDPALRERHVCGPTIIWNLRPTDSSHWEDGWFYNPDDGSTYRVRIELQSDDVLSARNSAGLLGKTKSLIRVPIGVSAGWC